MDANELFNDLQIAAIHEAGHAIVARHFGVISEAVVEPNTSWVPGLLQYTGYVDFHGKLHDLLPPDQAQLVLLAGAAAEALRLAATCNGEQICKYLDLGVVLLSKTDELWGHSETAFDECLEILRFNWDDVKELAEHLAFGALVDESIWVLRLPDR